MKIKLVTAFLFTLCATFGFAQKQFVKQANKLYANNAYSEASAMYLAMLQHKYDYEVNYKLAECYRYMNKPLEAEYWYAQLIQQNTTDPQILLNYAQLLKTNGKYKSAKKYFLEYAKYNPEGFYFAGTCDYAFYAQSKKSNYKLDTVSFNTKGSDITPAFFTKGILYASTGERTGEKNENVYLATGLPFYDIYYAKYDVEGKFLNGSKYNQLNTKMHEASPAYDKVHDQLFFTRNSYYKGRQKKAKDGAVKLDMYKATFDGEKIKNISSFPFNNKNYSVGQPAVSADGNILLFVSDMPGGFGGTDIYYSERSNEDWSAPKNLGATINSKGNEMFPYLSDSGKLYFSSDYLPGFGGLDIFISERRDNTWNTPQNAGMPVNSSRDDFGFIIKEGRGYFASNRTGGKGNDDIYACTQLNEITQVQVKNSDGLPVTEAKIILLENGHITNAGYTDANGYCPVYLSANNQYALNISKEGYADNNFTSLENYRSSDGVILIELHRLAAEQNNSIDSILQNNIQNENKNLQNEDEQKNVNINATGEYMYEVEIGAFKNPDYGKIASLAQYGELSVKSKEDGTLDFSITKLKTQQDAEQVKKEAFNRGFTDAFIITYRNGVREK